MAKTISLLLSLWAVGLIKCEGSAPKCNQRHVQVLYELNSKTTKCAGTLIHKQWVITAEACYKGVFGTLKVDLGPGSKDPIKVIKGTDILRPYPAPIWLLKLPEPEKNIEPVVLPPGDCLAPKVGESLQVSGHSFSKTDEETLMCLDVKISKCPDPAETDPSKLQKIFCGKDSVCKDPKICEDDYGSGLLKKVMIKEKGLFSTEKQKDVLYGVLTETLNENFNFVDICTGPIKKWLDEVLK